VISRRKEKCLYYIF